MPRETSRRDRTRRYDSSDSSDSEYSQKSSRRKKSDRSKRSHSREKTYRRRYRSSSRDRKRNRKSASRSPRYYSSRGRSTSRDRTNKKKYSRSSSRERSHSRDRSRDGNDYSRNKYKSKKSSRYESKKSSSRSSSSQDRDTSLISLEASKKYIVDDTVSKIEKAIKAAEAVGLKMCKIPTVPAPEFKEVKIKENMPTIQDRNVLDELNSDNFTPKQFTSSRPKKLPDNIVIDLEAGSVTIPEIDIPKVESVFHPDDEKTRMEKWVKKMYSFRQKALKGGIT